jgi:simple sugar transport system permease protein
MSSEVEKQAKQPSVPGRFARSPLERLVRKNGLQIGIVMVGVLIWLIFLSGAPRTFLSFNIYGAMMSTTPIFTLMALPLTMIIIAGEMDLSFPSVMAWGMTAFSLTVGATGSLELALLACLAAGLVAGVLNGFIVTQMGIPSLVATIGTQFFWRGVVLVITGGNGRSLNPTVGTLLHGGLVTRLFGSIPAQMLWAIFIAALIWLVLNRSKLGAHTYLVGDNVESAKLMGVNVRRTKLWIFAIMGVAAAFSGLVASMEVLYFWPTLGDGYLLTTLSSVFLGGTSVFGGVGTVFGTFIASFIIGSINAGIVAMGLAGFWTQLIYGVIIVLSVSMHAVVRRRLA